MTIDIGTALPTSTPDPAWTAEQLLPKLSAAINAGDPAEILQYFDEQACFVLPDDTVVRGHAELLALYTERLAMRPEITARAAKLVQTGDIALVTNVWSTRLRSGEMGGKNTFEGVATLVLRRQPDDTWRVLMDDSDR